MTETCNELMLEIRCDIPAGEPHQVHHTEMPLPSEVNKMLAASMDTLEQAAVRYRKARRWSLVMFGAWACCAAFYVGLIIFRIT